MYSSVRQLVSAWPLVVIARSQHSDPHPVFAPVRALRFTYLLSFICFCLCCISLVFSVLSLVVVVLSLVSIGQMIGWECPVFSHHHSRPAATHLCAKVTKSKKLSMYCKSDVNYSYSNELTCACTFSLVVLFLRLMTAVLFCGGADRETDYVWYG